MSSVASAQTDAKSQSSESVSSVPGLCLGAAVKHAKSDALNHKVGKDWIHISAEDFVSRVRNVALGLADMGIKPGDRIALLSENRPEWSIADLAILSLGAINVPIYTTQAVDQIRYILSDSSKPKNVGLKGMILHGRRVSDWSGTTVAAAMCFSSILDVFHTAVHRRQGGKHQK